MGHQGRIQKSRSLAGRAQVFHPNYVRVRKFCKPSAGRVRPLDSRGTQNFKE